MYGASWFKLSVVEFQKLHCVSGKGKGKARQQWQLKCQRFRTLLGTTLISPLSPPPSGPMLLQRGDDRRSRMLILMLQWQLSWWGWLAMRGTYSTFAVLHELLRPTCLQLPCACGSVPARSLAPLAVHRRG